MNNKDLNLDDFKIPAIAEGKVLPIGIEHELMKQEKEKHLRKQQRRHDWCIAIFGVLGGGVMGLLTSILFWLMTA